MTPIRLAKPLYQELKDAHVSESALVLQERCEKMFKEATQSPWLTRDWSLIRDYFVIVRELVGELRASPFDLARVKNATACMLEVWRLYGYLKGRIDEQEKKKKKIEVHTDDEESGPDDPERQPTL